MSRQSASPAGYGIRGRLNWVISGILGGVIGSLIFGGLLWTIDPEFVAVAIPALYGMDPAGATGWTFHLIHGLSLGVIFGFLVTREPILRILTADVETTFITNMGLATRFTLAGFVYGAVVWFLLPVLFLPIWQSLWGIDEPGFPGASLVSFIGHLIFGMLLGFFFAIFINIEPDLEQIESLPEDSTKSSPK